MLLYTNSKIITIRPSKRRMKITTMKKMSFKWMMMMMNRVMTVINRPSIPFSGSIRLINK